MLLTCALCQLSNLLKPNNKFSTSLFVPFQFKWRSLLLQSYFGLIFELLITNKANIYFTTVVLETPIYFNRFCIISLLLRGIIPETNTLLLYVRVNVVLPLCHLAGWFSWLNKFSSREFINLVLKLHSSCKKFIWFSISSNLLLHSACESLVLLHSCMFFISLLRSEISWRKNFAEFQSYLRKFMYLHWTEYCHLLVNFS